MLLLRRLRMNTSRKLAALAFTFIGIVLSVSYQVGGTIAAEQQAAAPRAAQQGAPAAQPNREAITAAPSRRPDEGKGPFKTLVIRGVTVIDGTGGPPAGPMDVVVSGNRITAVRSAGTPGTPMPANRGPQAEYEVD